MSTKTLRIRISLFLPGKLLKAAPFVSDPLFEQECLVCRNVINFLKFPCFECNNDVITYSCDIISCSKCNYDITIEYLVDKFGDVKDKDYYASPTHAYCDECEYYIETVVPLGNKYICLNCLAIHFFIEQCRYCGEMSTGNLEDSYLTGCVICDGKFWLQFVSE
jgi:hypothetical protein